MKLEMRDEMVFALMGFLQSLVFALKEGRDKKGSVTVKKDNQECIRAIKSAFCKESFQFLESLRMHCL